MWRGIEIVFMKVQRTKSYKHRQAACHANRAGEVGLILADKGGAATGKEAA